MGLLEWILKPRHATEEERKRASERLDAKRRHLRGRMSKATGDIQRAWTQYRTWRDDEDVAGKKKLRTKIRELEGRRKAMVKEMLKLQAEMKKLGHDEADVVLD